MFSYPSSPGAWTPNMTNSTFDEESDGIGFRNFIFPAKSHVSTLRNFHENDMLQMTFWVLSRERSIVEQNGFHITRVSRFFVPRNVSSHLRFVLLQVSRTMYINPTIDSQVFVLMPKIFLHLFEGQHCLNPALSEIGIRRNFHVEN